MDLVPLNGMGNSPAMAPAMPVIRPCERTGSPYPLVEGLGHGIGWQYRPGKHGGPVFVTLGRGALGARKVIGRFPLTEAGWEMAWNALARLDPGAAGKVRQQLADREREERQQEEREQRRQELDHAGAAPELARLDAVTLGCMRAATLIGGYATQAPILIGERYDVRFLDDRIAVCTAGGWRIRAGMPYEGVEDVEIGGPGLVKSGGGFSGGGFGVAGALEGMAIAGVLNALTTRTSVTTIVRLQGKDSEMFFLHTTSAPEQLRMELSRALAAIRAANAGVPQGTAAAPPPAAPVSPVGELAELAGLLNAGLVTREEFEQLKAKILQA
jgi:hypothetical protein